MNSFLLELFSEEIPAKMQQPAIEELRDRMGKSLRDARIDFREIKGFVTPRRMALLVGGLPDTQPDMLSETKGPRVSAPDKAIEGFCRSVGMQVDELEIRTKGKDKFYFAVKRQKGKNIREALKEIIESDVLKDFPWVKSQRWGREELHWIRPLRRIVSVLKKEGSSDNDEDMAAAEIVPVRLGHIVASNVTEGHRFLSEGEITIDNPADYESVLEKHYVMADAAKRRKKIVRDMAELASTKDLSVRQDKQLLDEVVGLVEWPVCLMGEFDREFLKLPAEVLILEMRHHQKYFACMNEKAELSNYFLLVSNMVAEDGGAAIIKGNQRVLHARLSDGQFYWEKDCSIPLSSERNMSQLKKMIFHAKLGSIADKVERMASLGTFLAVFIPRANLQKVERAIYLSKVDLVSGMVGEFPELQGIMGRYYAIQQGEDAEVCDAIAEHYKPSGANDDIPTSPVGITVALADRLDSIVGLFAAGEKPTGSKDPFALRRMALAIIRIVVNNGLRIPLRIAIENALDKYPDSLFCRKMSFKEKVSAKISQAVKESSGGGDGVCNPIDVKNELEDELLEFFASRLKVMLRDEGIRHDLIESVFDSGKEDDLTRLVSRVHALSEFLSSDDGQNLLIAYRRAANILCKEEEKDNISYNTALENEKLVDILHDDVEKELLKVLVEVSTSVSELLKEEKYKEAMASLAGLRKAVDSFFDNVIVNADDEELRKTRLGLLAGIRELFNRIANFSRVE